MINRRTYLQTAALAPFGLSRSSIAAKTDEESSALLDNIGRQYFAALAHSDSDSQTAVVDCANRLCETKEWVDRETITSLSEGVQTSDNGIRRARLAVGILNEYNITDVVTESEVLKGERKVRSYSKYVPLLGSYNNLCAKACSVSEAKPETIKQFLYASLALGIEVGLWSMGAPYKMAWRGTRFVANRSFLRYARNGCSRCVALLMSELHWVQRDVLHLTVSEDSVTFVMNELADLREFAKQELDTEEDYSAHLHFTEEDVIQIVSEGGEGADRVIGGGGIIVQESPSLIDRILSSIESYLPIPLVALVAIAMRK